MSKKTFKQTIGALYKEGYITIAPDSISLIKK
jgi:predicted RNA-binding protein (virulence factor B family)